MHRSLSFAIFSMCMIIALGSLGAADETSTTLAYVQGENVSIMQGTNGHMEIVVENTISYLNWGSGVNAILLPIHLLEEFPRPFYAALSFLANKPLGQMIVEVDDLSLDETTQKLSLTVKPVEYYEGTLLKSFTRENTTDTPGQLDRVIITSIFLEIPQITPDNANPIMPGREDYGSGLPECELCFDWRHNTMVPCCG